MSEETKPKINYVNNKELYAAIVDWKKKCAEAGHQVKQNDTIGMGIILIAEGLSHRFNFSGYTGTWKQEMISDGIEASVKGLINFDETKYFNPHAYITQACFNAFVQRIKKERRENASKYSYFINHVYDANDDDMVAIADEDFIQDIFDKLQQYESSQKTAKKVDAPDIPTLDFLYEDS